jgi:UDP-N-acetylglucosamine--N-acetylmuramyl-(pentapeptide) pyrophosphoryl-undecaprenol N-acetylglucosamine transferase
MHIVVTGGGTGGHVFPAIEIAKEFVQNDSRTKITYVGNFGGTEERMAKNCGFRFFGLKTKQIVGKSLIAKMIALFYLKLAVLRCLYFLLRHRPHAVIGVGGYVSAPMIIASFILRINRYICEQNVVPGLANRVLAYLSNKVFISFADSKSYFPKNSTLLSGNPIRKQFFGLEPSPINGDLKILVSGGSLGATFLNLEVPKALSLLKKNGASIEVTHQTGITKLAQVEENYREAHINAKIIQFIDNMPEAFRNHSLLVSRAGATVAAEIMASGMPAILVPYRFANGHQRDNALALVKLGAAVLIEENEDFADKLSMKLKEFYEQPEKLKEISKNAKLLATPKAASNIVKAVISDL